MSGLPILLALAAAGALRPLTFSDPVLHVAVQLPLLAYAGWELGRRLQWGRAWPTSLLIVSLTAAAFWMLPRSIDAALSSPWLDAAKFASVFALAGLPLGLAWPHLSAVLRGFLKAQSISMLGALGFLYLIAPARLCNAYLSPDQKRLGLALLFLAAALALRWTLPALVGRRRPHRHAAQGVSA